MKNILENEYHTQVLDRWIKVCRRNGLSLTVDYICYAVRSYLFPEYKTDPQLEEKIKVILEVSAN